MLLASEEDVQAVLGRALTETETQRAPTLLTEASALVAAHTRTTFEDPVPDVVRVVTARMVANVLEAQSGVPTPGHAESVSHQAGPWSRNVKLAEGSTSGSPWLTRQLKMMLSPWTRSGVSVGMTSERYAP
ncbi:hypothetical protein R3P82_12645 [Dietzia maris]|uniref:Head-to-tail adaptor n=1 Tax=Dietzia maris TaxID=37915 RepID=A0AAE4QZB6_9ACTN|nr:hypothetical protein [Dietzia maris]MDV6299958.1 hypothetical protein [Dietzia maris]